MYPEAPAAARSNTERVAAIIPKAVFSMTQQTAVAKLGLLDLSLYNSIKPEATFIQEGSKGQPKTLKGYLIWENWPKIIQL